jgi:polyphenol oxidase
VTESVWITPSWSAHARVRAVVTTRAGGYSSPPYHGFNVAAHVKDDPSVVARNRQLLQDRIGASNRLFWVNQVHGSIVRVLSEQESADSMPNADAIYTRHSQQALAIMTADCLPMFLAAADGSEIAVVHAGWRGLSQGVVENTLACFQCDPGQIHAWLGPAIGPDHFEVGEEVRQTFLQKSSVPELISTAFKPAALAGKWWADLYQIARIRLVQAGVTSVAGGQYCTYRDEKYFYSYRRDHVTGRMASVIWLD